MWILRNAYVTVRSCELFILDWFILTLPKRNRFVGFIFQRRKPKVWKCRWRTQGQGFRSMGLGSQHSCVCSHPQASTCQAPHRLLKLSKGCHAEWLGGLGFSLRQIAQQEWGLWAASTLSLEGQAKAPAWAGVFTSVMDSSNAHYLL